MEYSFPADNALGLILAKGSVQENLVYFILDTAASDTVIDLNMALILELEIDFDPDSALQFETSNGLINAYPVRLPNLKVLGIDLPNFQAYTYDFLQAGIVSQYDGLLGLDFFKNTRLTLDFTINSLSLELPIL